MFSGDLATTPLPDVLRALAADRATGCLRVDAPGGTGLVYLKVGQVYGASAPDRRPALGSRLISSGALVPEDLAEALEVQRLELQGWRLGELLVHLGFVERPVVEAYVVEQLRDAVTDLAQLPFGAFRFRKGERTRTDVAPARDVETLLDEVSSRVEHWHDLARTVRGPLAVPVLSAGDATAQAVHLRTESLALLGKVDGARTLADLARDCGFTLHEAGQLVHELVEMGLLDVHDPDGEPAEADEGVAEAGSDAEEDDDFGRSVRRVSEALSAVLGARPVDDDPYAVPERAVRERTWAPGPETREDPAAAARRASREAASAELAQAHATALAQQGPPPHDTGQEVPPQEVPPQEVAPQQAVVDLEARRVDVDAVRRVGTALRLVPALVHVESAWLALASQEDARREEERRAAEQAEAERAEAEQAAAEQAEAERAAAERAAEERAAAERAEAERAAAEAEAERLATEQAAAQVEAERAAAAQAEAESLAAEQAPAPAQHAAPAAAAVDQAAAEDEEDSLAWLSRLDLDETADAAVPAVVSGPAPGTPATGATETVGSTEPAPAVATAARRPVPATGADKAHLLRELTSLGLDDEPPPATPVPRKPAPRAPEKAPPKRKRGLFGLG